MNYYFVTGISSGIGEEFVLQLLKNDNNIVYGISRRNYCNHKRYIYIETDLSKMDNVLKIEFPELTKPGKIVLINNAGQVGDIKPVGKSDNTTIINMYNVNLITPFILMNNFMNFYENVDSEKIIINISSGAGERPIEGWAPYCSSKAGLNLLSKTVYEEQKNAKFPVKVFSISPGVVDTEMQNIIRNSDKKDFPRHSYFVELKNKDQLEKPEKVVKKYIQIIEKSKKINKCLFGLYS